MNLQIYHTLPEAIDALIEVLYKHGWVDWSFDIERRQYYDMSLRYVGKYDQNIRLTCLINKELSGGGLIDYPVEDCRISWCTVSTFLRNRNGFAHIPARYSLVEFYKMWEIVQKREEAIRQQLLQQCLTDEPSIMQI